MFLGFASFLWSLPSQAFFGIGCQLRPVFVNVPGLDMLLLPWSSSSYACSGLKTILKLGLCLFDCVFQTGSHTTQLVRMTLNP